MKNTLQIALVALLFSAVAYAQAPDYNCDVDMSPNGNSGTAKCKPDVPFDQTPEGKAEAARRAANDKQLTDAGAAFGNVFASILDKHAMNKGIRKYCDQHPGEPSHWQENGQVVWRGTCPGEMSQATAQKLVINAFNESFKKSGVAGYAEVVGDRLTVHSERASAIRFQMVLHDPANQSKFKTIAQAGIATYVYTNDADVNLTYDVKSGQILIAPTEPATAFSEQEQEQKLESMRKKMEAQVPESVKKQIDSVCPDISATMMRFLTTHPDVMAASGTAQRGTAPGRAIREYIDANNLDLCSDASWNQAYEALKNTGAFKLK